MSLAPDVQWKAQAELDNVLGSRLPTMEDLASLPYIRAVFMETMRWTPVTPTSVHHRLVDGEGDEFHGYLIPGGSTIIPVRRVQMFDTPSKFLLFQEYLVRLSSRTRLMTAN